MYALAYLSGAALTLLISIISTVTGKQGSKARHLDALPYTGVVLLAVAAWPLAWLITALDFLMARHRP